MFAHIIGFGLSLASMLWIPGYALYYICMQRGNLRDVSTMYIPTLYVFFPIHENIYYVHNILHFTEIRQRNHTQHYK